jgi:hypothetical protein
MAAVMDYFSDCFVHFIDYRTVCCIQVTDWAIIQEESFLCLQRVLYYSKLNMKIENTIVPLWMSVTFWQLIKHNLVMVLARYYENWKQWLQKSEDFFSHELVFNFEKSSSVLCRNIIALEIVFSESVYLMAKLVQLVLVFSQIIENKFESPKMCAFLFTWTVLSIESKRH